MTPGRFPLPSNHSIEMSGKHLPVRVQSVRNPTSPCGSDYHAERSRTNIVAEGFRNFSGTLVSLRRCAESQELPRGW